MNLILCFCVLAAFALARCTAERPRRQRYIQIARPDDITIRRTRPVHVSGRVRTRHNITVEFDQLHDLDVTQRILPDSRRAG